MNVEGSFKDIYRRTAAEAVGVASETRLGQAPEFIEPPTFLEGLHAVWAGDNWFGRIVAEDLAGSLMYRKMFGNEFSDTIDPNWNPVNQDFTGVEQFMGELMATRSALEFAVKKANIRDRQQRNLIAGQRNGFMHHVVGHILDPTILIGYGVGRAALGAPARVVGARVAAVETGLVAGQQGLMAARYDDRVAADAVRASAYAAGFSFVLGTGLAHAIHKSKGRMWAGGRMDAGLRRDAAAARQTTAHVVDETAPGSAERVERVAAQYAKPLNRLAGTESKLVGQLDGIAAKLGVKADELTDERLAQLYEAGDKATRQRVQRARKLRNKIGEARAERQLFDLERALAETSKDSELWQSNTMAAMFAGRAGFVRSMAPRVRVVSESQWERGVEGLPDEVNNLITDAYERLRFGARKLTRSHGMDTSTGKMAGANVEDAHLRRITQLYAEDDVLRTAAISALHKSALSGIRHAPVTRNITGTFKWMADKLGELPAVITGRAEHKFGPYAGAEDELERALQLLQEKATTAGAKLNVDHVNLPQEVKDLFLWRQGQYQEIGTLLRKHSATYVGKVLDEQIAEVDVLVKKAEIEMEANPVGSPGWDRAHDTWRAASERLEMLRENLALYKAAENPGYIPVHLAAHKVRGNKDGFIKAAIEHFRENPGIVLRRPRSQLAGPTRQVDTGEFEFQIQGRALAMWHATVERVDYSGRPVGRSEFIRRIEKIMDTLAPTRRAQWEAHDNYIRSLQLAEAAKKPELVKGLPADVGPNIKFPSAQNAEEAAWDALFFRVEGLKRSESLAREGRSGRFLQSEMFATAELSPARFRDFMEDRPTVQFKSYLEREIRRIEAAEKLGDPDAAGPMVAANRNLDEIDRLAEQELARAKLEKREPTWTGDQIPDDLRAELTGRIEDYDLLRRQMMGEVLFEGDNAFLDSMNELVGLATNVSVAADLGMAGYSVTIDLGQMLAYYGLGPVKLARLGRAMMKDTELRRLMLNREVAAQLGVAGEVARGARLRAIQGADLSFGNQGGFVPSGNRLADVGRWIGNVYSEAASNIMTASLLNPITDLTQQLAAPLATTRIMQAIGRVATGKGQKVDANILRRLGMDDEMAQKVWAQFATSDPANQGVRILSEAGGAPVPTRPARPLNKSETELLNELDLVRRRLERAATLAERGPEIDATVRAEIDEILQRYRMVDDDPDDFMTGLKIHPARDDTAGMPAAWRRQANNRERLAAERQAITSAVDEIQAVLARLDPELDTYYVDALRKAIREHFRAENALEELWPYIKNDQMFEGMAATSVRGGEWSGGQAFQQLGGMMRHWEETVDNAVFARVNRMLKNAEGRTLDEATVRQELDAVRAMLDDIQAGRVPDEAADAAAKVEQALATEGAIIMPKFSEWADQALAQDVMSMISGDIRVATLHPGIAANRIWKGMGGALQAVGRMYYLFTRWAMVANANVYAKNIEDGTNRHIATAIAYSTAIQMMVNWMKEPDFVEDTMMERMKDAFVMGGGLGYMGILNERLERLSGHRYGLRPMLGVDTFAHDPDSPQFIMSGLGPVTGKVGGAITHIDEQNYGRLMRLFMPYQNWWLWAGAVRDTSQYADFGEAQ